ncbi:MAG: hypothetical protein IPJ32_20545 [Sphingobacteriaceae bacterium]|nr:hypothetical protein [Sphingobacteriaceae bacterium]
MHRLKEFDLIVIPDFSRKPLERLFADINPLEIMNRTNTAVIAVNRNSRKFGIKRIVLPIRNVKNWYDKIPFTSAIAKLTGAKIYIVGVANSTTKLVIDRIEQKMEFCKSHFQKFGIIYEAETIFGHGEIFKDIILLSNYKRADLIAVSPPINHSIIKSYFNTSLYNKLISKSNIPVMGVTLT